MTLSVYYNRGLNFFQPGMSVVARQSHVAAKGERGVIKSISKPHQAGRTSNVINVIFAGRSGKSGQVPVAMKVKDFEVPAGAYPEPPPRPEPLGQRLLY